MKEEENIVDGYNIKEEMRKLDEEDRRYWRYTFAGQMLVTLTHKPFQEAASIAAKYADALLEELEK